jgi:anti-sigma factor RsiW
MHLTDEQLNEYLDHESSERSDIEVHLSACADCAARLATLQALFDEIMSLPDLELTRPIAARLTLSSSHPTALPRSLTLTVTLQAALAVVTIILAAPYVMRSVAPYLMTVRLPSFAEILFQAQSQWIRWLDVLSTFQRPAFPQLPPLEISSLMLTLGLVGVSVLWLVGNGLLLRNRTK